MFLLLHWKPSFPVIDTISSHKPYELIYHSIYSSQLKQSKIKTTLLCQTKVQTNIVKLKFYNNTLFIWMYIFYSPVIINVCTGVYSGCIQLNVLWILHVNSGVWNCHARLVHRTCRTSRFSWLACQGTSKDQQTRWTVS